VNNDPEEIFDVIVLGTGASGLTAALAAHSRGASVVVFEKGEHVGGTSAWSGGMVWIPNNHHMAEAGLHDSREEVLTYLESLSHGMIEPHLAEAFIDAGPEMVRWLEADTPVTFDIVEGFPDYHPEHPGGKPDGGRSLECPLFSFDELGEWSARVTVGRQSAANVVMNETTLGRGEEPDPAEIARRQKTDERGCGQALVGRLLKACLDRGIEPRPSSPVSSLVIDDGRVVGVRVAGAAGETVVGARGGVIIATGGFEWNADLVRSFIRGPLVRSVSVPTNTGDGLKMAMRAGAALGTMREAWWVPVIDVPDTSGGTFAWMVNRERTRPRTIMVNRAGRRFANEAANYNAFGAAFHQLDSTSFEYSNVPCWMLFDQVYLARYGLAGYRGEGEPPEWLTRAETLDELAAQLGIDPGGLVDTVERFNTNAEAGVDPEFGRGLSRHDTWWGDPNQPGSAATLGPIDAAPYWAVQVHSGALGTKGGPRTTGDAQVIDLDGVPIAGLYAAGNAMSSVMGMTYGGGGGTLAPGMVFGYLGGRAAAHAAGSTAGQKEQR
jgi:3-oxosteroid 1-dehydrogenase